MKSFDLLKRLIAIFLTIGCCVLFGYLAKLGIISPHAKLSATPLKLKTWVDIFQLSLVGIVVVVTWNWTWFRKPFIDRKSK